MKTIIHIVKSGVFMLLAALSFVACTDKNDWEVDSSYDRLFSITKMSISANATDAEYTFTANSKADYYIIELSKDSLYDAIEMGQHDSSVVYGEDKSMTSSPIALEDLDSDTKYYLRIKAFSSTGQSSIWAYLEDVYFTTKSEQIITTVTAGVNDVTIEWPADSKATHVTVSEGSTVIATKDLTADEITAGEVTVTGLTSETSYTIKLMNGTTTRGSETFTTLMDLGGATAIYPEDDIVTILTTAEEGDIYALMSGTYDIDAIITLTKSISVKAAVPGEAIVNGLAFDLKAGVGLDLKDLVLDGTNATAQLINYADDYNTGDTSGLSISGCDIRNYSSGFINQRVSIAVSSMSITGNFFNQIGGRFIDIQKGYAKTIDLSENTIANSISGDAIRIDNSAGDFTGVSSIITISNNTFYKVCNGAISNRLIYTRLTGHEITLSKNLIINSVGIYSNQSSTKVAGMTDNYYFEATGYLSASEKVSDANGTEVDPEFADPENLDFTVRSNAIINAGIGDPSWLN